MIDRVDLSPLKVTADVKDLCRHSAIVGTPIDSAQSRAKAREPKDAEVVGQRPPHCG